MIKRLSIDELEPGMYVCALEKPGLPEPLSFMNNILVKSREDIDGYRRAGYIAAHVDLPDEEETPGGASPEGFSSGGADFPAEMEELPEAETEPDGAPGGLMGNSREEDWQAGDEGFDLDGLLPDEEPGLDSSIQDLDENLVLDDAADEVVGAGDGTVETAADGPDETFSRYGDDLAAESDEDTCLTDDQSALDCTPFDGTGPEEGHPGPDGPVEGFEEPIVAEEEPSLEVIEAGPEPGVMAEETAAEIPEEDFPEFPEAPDAMETEDPPFGGGDDFLVPEADEDYVAEDDSGGLAEEDLPPRALMEEPDEGPEPVAGAEGPAEDPFPAPEVIEPLALEEEDEAESGRLEEETFEAPEDATGGEELELAPEGCFDLSEGADDSDEAFGTGDSPGLPFLDAEEDETPAIVDAGPEEVADDIVPEGPVPDDEGRRLEIVDGPAPAPAADTPEGSETETEGAGPIPGLEEAIEGAEAPAEGGGAKPPVAGPGCVNDDYKEKFSDYKEELAEAKQVRSQAEGLVRDFMSSVSRGDGIDTDRVHGTVEKMVGSIFRNQDALTSLARLKSVDDYTFAHCVNVCTLAITLGRHIGLTKDELQDLGVGALLHDVGKVLVPEEILKKPGKLTDEEFAYMQSHTELGAELLDKTDGVNASSRDVAIEHHERHDGTGYPRGISGADISLYGRITAVADVYDAMTSNRCYQRGMKSDEALKKMYMWRGSRFEPTLVERLIRCLGIYPVGTLVELNTGEVAVVRLPNHTHPLQPLVMMVYDRSGRAYPKPFASALKEDSNRWIVSSRAPEDFGEALQDLAACV